MSDGWINAWPLLLIFAAGIALGRWIERRRAKRSAVTLAAKREQVDIALKTLASGHMPWDAPQVAIYRCRGCNAPTLKPMDQCSACAGDR